LKDVEGNRNLFGVTELYHEKPQ